MSKLIEILGKITDVVCLSLMWLVFSLPIITIGASTTALYHTVTKVLLGDKGYIAKEFIYSFKSNFKQATIVWIIAISILALLVVDFWILKTYVSKRYYNLLLVILLYLLVTMAMFVNCLFPSIARFEATIKQIFKNCFVFTVIHLPWALLAVLVLVVAIVIVYLSPITIVCVPTLYMICESKIYEHIFKKYIKEKI